MEGNFMSSRLQAVQVSWVPVLAAMLLLAPSIASISAEDRIRLSADILTTARGGDPTVVLLVSSCDALQTNFPCALIGVGGNCTTCGFTSYTDLITGSSGGFTTGSGSQSCGANWAGTCNASNVCVTSTPVGWCQNPANIVTQ
jgi:hypothetical protein